MQHALIKEQRLLHLQQEHDWTIEEMFIAEYLIDEPGPACLLERDNMGGS
jgi:hypothetical protein